MVFSDNGSQYTSQRFSQFTKSWDFDHQTSSPEYPQSNGLAERFVQTVKRILKKAFISGGDPYKALLTLNTTANNQNESPASVLMRRTLRTTLPTIWQGDRSTEIHQPIIQPQQRGRKLPEIPTNTTVRIQSKNKNDQWSKKGVVLTKRAEPRSYDVLNEKGNVIRRNRRHLIPTNEDF